MMVAESTKGSESKADCLVTVRPSETREIEVVTRSARLVEPGIRVAVSQTLDQLGANAVAVRIQENGSPDYVIAARVEAAVREVMACESVCTPSIARVASDRDRPRRSRLYAPGNNPRLLAGIDIHGADCVLLDLEDAVPPAEKASARILVKRLLCAVGFPEEVWVRINPLANGGIDDLAEVLQGRPHGICLPKAESAEDVRAAAAEMTRIEAELGITDRRTWIMPILETGRGVLRCDEIVEADERVVMVAFGAEDYTRDIGARRTNESLLFARSRIVAAAKAASVQASDTVYADLSDPEGLATESQRARDLGFDGKGAINPRQLGPIHQTFSPTEEEIAQARDIVDAAAEAEAQGLGAVTVRGRMVDRPVLERAQRLLRFAGKLTREGGS